MLRAPHAQNLQDSRLQGRYHHRQRPNNYICGPEERAELIALRHDSLKRIAASKGLALPPIPAEIVG